MNDEFLSVSETARLLGISPSTLRRLEKNGVVEGYGLRVNYTPGGQRRYVFDEVQSLYTNQGFSGNLGLGKRPALLIRDLTVAFTTNDSQLTVKLEENQIKVISELIDEAIENDVPVIFSMTIYDASNKSSKLWGQKFPNIQLLDENSIWTQIHPDLADKAYSLVNKTVYITDFYKSQVEDFLIENEIDTLILAGTTTSGSIRATAVDALQHGFKVIIPKEAVADRSFAIQTFTLMDLNARYADVMTVNKVLEFLRKEK